MTEPQFHTTRFSKIMNYDSFQALSQATMNKRSKCRYDIPMTKYFTQKRPTRLLTKCILEYIRSIGGHAEEVKSTGTMRKDRSGKMIWTHSQTMSGSADIHAVIAGRFVAIEIKYGKDKQSEAQKKYQEKVEQSGARYLIVKNFDHLIDAINNL